MVVIYLIASKKGSKCYVGSTKDLNRRMIEHKRRINQCAYQLKKEYGWENLIFTVLEECTEETRKECEQYWLDFVPNTINTNRTFVPKRVKWISGRFV